MISSFDVATRGYLAGGTFPIASRGYLGDAVLDVEIVEEIEQTFGGGTTVSPGPVATRSIADMYADEVEKQNEYYKRMKQDDEDILIIIKAFLQCL